MTDYLYKLCCHCIPNISLKNNFIKIHNSNFYYFLGSYICEDCGCAHLIIPLARLIKSDFRGKQSNFLVVNSMHIMFVALEYQDHLCSLFII